MSTNKPDDVTAQINVLIGANNVYSASMQAVLEAIRDLKAEEGALVEGDMCWVSIEASVIVANGTEQARTVASFRNGFGFGDGDLPKAAQPAGEQRDVIHPGADAHLEAAQDEGADVPVVEFATTSSDEQPGG